MISGRGNGDWDNEPSLKRVLNTFKPCDLTDILKLSEPGATIRISGTTHKGAIMGHMGFAGPIWARPFGLNFSVWPCGPFWARAL